MTRSLEIDLRDCVGSELVSIGVQVLDLAIVGPLVRHIERRADRTAVRILSTSFEQILVQLFVKIVNRVVKRQ